MGDARDPKGGVDNRRHARPSLREDTRQRAIHERGLAALARLTPGHVADPGVYAAVARDQRPLSPDPLGIDTLASRDTPIDIAHEVHDPVARLAVYAAITSATIAADYPRLLIGSPAQHPASDGRRTVPDHLTGVGA